VLGAVMAVPGGLLAGIHLALAADVLLTLTALTLMVFASQPSVTSAAAGR
jgi:hypothetical protein